MTNTLDGWQILHYFLCDERNGHTDRCGRGKAATETRAQGLPGLLAQNADAGGILRRGPQVGMQPGQSGADGLIVCVQVKVGAPDPRKVLLRAAQFQGAAGLAQR